MSFQSLNIVSKCLPRVLTDLVVPSHSRLNSSRGNFSVTINIYWDHQLRLSRSVVCFSVSNRQHSHNFHFHNQQLNLEVTTTPTHCHKKMNRFNWCKLMKIHNGFIWFEAAVFTCSPSWQISWNAAILTWVHSHRTDAVLQQWPRDTRQDGKQPKCSLFAFIFCKPKHLLNKAASAFGTQNTSYLAGCYCIHTVYKTPYNVRKFPIGVFTRGRENAIRRQDSEFSSHFLSS